MRSLLVIAYFLLHSAVTLASSQCRDILRNHHAAAEFADLARLHFQLSDISSSAARTSLENSFASRYAELLDRFGEIQTKALFKDALRGARKGIETDKTFEEIARLLENPDVDRETLEKIIENRSTPSALRLRAFQALIRRNYNLYEPLEIWLKLSHKLSEEEAKNALADLEKWLQERDQEKSLGSDVNVHALLVELRVSEKSESDVRRFLDSPVIAHYMEHYSHLNSEMEVRLSRIANLRRLPFELRKRAFLQALRLNPTSYYVRQAAKYLNDNEWRDIRAEIASWEKLDDHESQRTVRSLRGALFEVRKVKDLESLLNSRFRDFLDPNAKNDWGQSRLMTAAADGNVALLKALLKIPGVDVNHRDRAGRTALTQAAGKGHPDVVRVLLRRPGININSVDSRGMTALMFAAKHGQADVVRILLAVPGIDVSKVDSFYQESALKMATNAKVIELLRGAGGK